MSIYEHESDIARQAYRHGASVYRSCVKLITSEDGSCRASSIISDTLDELKACIKTLDGIGHGLYTIHEAMSKFGDKFVLHVDKYKEAYAREGCKSAYEEYLHIQKLLSTLDKYESELRNAYKEETGCIRY